MHPVRITFGRSQRCSGEISGAEKWKNESGYGSGIRLLFFRIAVSRSLVEIFQQLGLEPLADKMVGQEYDRGAGCSDGRNESKEGAVLGLGLGASQEIDIGGVGIIRR